VTPERFLRIVRDGLVLAVGTFFSVYLPVTHQFEWWAAPLIAGCFGFVLTAPRGPREPPS
jgi:hypothetical protein